MFRILLVNLFTILCMIFPAVTYGATFGMDFLVNGFGTVCASKSDLPKQAYVNIPYYPFATTLGVVSPYIAPAEYTPAYVGAGRRWDFLPNSKFGLQFTALFNDKFKAVTQLVGGSESMTNNNFYVQMDWAYLQYNPVDALDLQFGRVRLPLFYYSDYLKVNHAQPWVTPPEEVYFISAGAFQNLDGIRASYSFYWQDWTANTKFWYGSMQEQLSILNRDIIVSVRDGIGAGLQVGNDRFSIQGSLMRSIYNTTLNDPLSGLVTATQRITGTFTSAQQLQSMLQDTNVPIVYVGLALSANILENLDLLVERASIFSRGIISTARLGWYGSLTYSFLEKYAMTFTYGYSRPLQTETNKYDAVKAFFTSPQYLNFIDKNSGAGAAVINLFQTYLGEQRSYAIDLRYDILPSVSLKGAVKYITPIDQSAYALKYLFARVQTQKHIWVYRVSFDFVF